MFLFTGAQSTGKTTLLRHIVSEYPENTLVTNVVRDLKKNSSIAINKQGNYNSQQIIFNTLENKLEAIDNNIILGDRGLIDVVAFTKYLYTQNVVSEYEYHTQLKCLENWHLKHQNDCIYMYTPIEFPAVSDGIRDVDECYREYIDKTIHELLELSNIEYHIITGTVSDRLDKVRNIINSKIL